METKELNKNELEQVQGGIIAVLALAFARGYNTGTMIYEYFKEKN